MLALLALSAAFAAAPPQLDVLSTSVTLDVDRAQQRFAGVATLRFEVAGEVLVLDAVDLDVRAVRLDGRSVDFSQVDGQLRVDIPRRRKVHTVEVSYAGGPSEGLRFEEGAVYTGFDTRRWMPCHFALGDRSTFELRLGGLPEDWATVGNGREVSPGRWRLEREHPAYLLGFVASELRSEGDAASGVAVWTNPSTPPGAASFRDELDRMSESFATQSGRPLPGGRYDVVFVPGKVMQEKADFALLGDSYAAELLANPQEDWLLAHELSHGWWGNTVTAATWSDFWLNEALSTYVTNVWKRERWGEAAYAREVELSQRRARGARERGQTRPLALPPGATPEEAGGGLVYSLGFLALDALRTEVGTEAFDAALRALMGKSGEWPLSTDQLQRTMEAAAGRDLGLFFDTWVRSGAAPYSVRP